MNYSEFIQIINFIQMQLQVITHFPVCKQHDSLLNIVQKYY